MRARHTASRLKLLCVFALVVTCPGTACPQILSAQQLNKVGIEQFRNHQYENALSTFGDTLRLFEAVEDQGGQATALSEMAMCLDGLGQKEKALDYLEKALPKWRQLGDRENEA